MNYYRAFIALKEERQDFRAGGKAAQGRAVIESRGKWARVNVYAQDLKPQAEYRICMIASQHGHNLGTEICALPVNARGQAQARAEFDAENVNGTGLPVSQFNIVALMVPGGREAVAPLVGYKDAPVPWRMHLSMKGGTETKESTGKYNLPKAEPDKASPELPADTPEPEDAHNLQEGPPSSEAVPPEDDGDMPARVEDFFDDIPEERPEDTAPPVRPHGEYNRIVREFNEKMNSLENYSMFSEEELAAMKEPVQEPKPEQGSPIPKPGSARELEYVLTHNIKMTPFASQKTPVDWVRVTPRELMLLPFDHKAYINNPIVANGYRKFKHLILGRVVQGNFEKFIVGAPDVYTLECGRRAYDMGFRFKCCEEKQAQEGSHGYWLTTI